MVTSFALFAVTHITSSKQQYTTRIRTLPTAHNGEYEHAQGPRGKAGDDSALPQAAEIKQQQRKYINKIKIGCLHSPESKLLRQTEGNFNKKWRIVFKFIISARDGRCDNLPSVL